MTASINDFPDRPHLERIRAYLWRGRALGQAAVMVGSGFSRNAEPIGIGAPPFPLWLDLAGKLYDALVPHYGPSTDARHQEIALAAANGGVLRLALEYQTMFGAGALDDLIEQVIPDQTYQPGELHRLLLQLPWSDVFTTNYDTLLERTLPQVLERRYEVVLAPHDLPGRRKPRIVKLHGTIPTHRPYVLHEEDYRTYPAQYAPFVNTVQQSLMENVFVLIGFSGDDPNFLQWLGWVRDRLQRVSQPAYLCGLLNLSDARRQMLLKLNVVPVDLGPLFPKESHLDESSRHHRAMRWLLMSLKNGAPLDPLDWPESRKSEVIVVDPAELLPLPGPPPLEPEPAGPNHNPLSEDDVRLEAERLATEIVHIWRHKRERYPGWVVLPAANRPMFRRRTEAWSEKIVEYIREMETPAALMVLGELVWRRKRAGLPLFDVWDVDFERVLNGVLLFPDLQQRPGMDVPPIPPPGLDLAYLRECWINVAFALARRGRQDGDEAFQQWMDRLETVVRYRLEWSARWHYEKCLYHLYRSEQREVRYWAERWPAFEHAPFWQTRRAAVLAEIGDVADAAKLAEDALLRIRSLLRLDEENIELLSQEGWTMLLLDSTRTDSLTPSGGFRGRWDQLARYRCDPWVEVEHLRTAVQLAVPRRAGEKERYIDPFTGLARETIHLGGRSEAILTGFAMILLLEDAGIPLRCGRTVIYLKEAVRAARLVAPSAFAFATGTILRASDKDSAFDWFDLVRIAKLSDMEVARYIDVLRTSIIQALDQLARVPDLHNESFSSRQITVKVELLSRFSFRMSAATITETLLLALKWCELPAVQQNDWAHQHMDHLITRLLDAADVDTWARHLPALLRFPLPDSGEVRSRFPDWWPEPLGNARIPAELRNSAEYDQSAVHSAADRLALVARDGSPEARSRALLRLFAIHGAQLLGAEQQRSYGTALWARINSDTQLPLNSQLYPFVLLQLPEPEIGLAERSVRAYLTSCDFPRSIRYVPREDGSQGLQSSRSRDPQHLITIWCRSTVAEDPDEQGEPSFDWSRSEVEALLTRISSWWDDQKAYATRADRPDFVIETLQDDFGTVHRILRRTIIPRINGDEVLQETVVQLLIEFEQLHVRIMPVLPHMLRLNQNSFERSQIAEVINVALRSEDEDRVRDAAEAIYRWIVAAGQKRLPEAPRDLLSELIQRFRILRRTGLTAIIAWLWEIVRYAPSALDEPALDEIGIGLQHLLVETELPSEENRPVSEIRSPEYQEMLLLPTLRGFAARLAGECLRQLQLDILPPSEKLRAAADAWAIAMEEEVLPNVRRAWSYGLRPAP